MLFLFFLVVWHILWIYRKTNILLLPSVIFLSLEFLLQVFFPYTLVEALHEHPMHNRAAFIIGTGYCTTLIGYHATLLFGTSQSLERTYYTTLTTKYKNIDPYLQRALIGLFILGCAIIPLVFAVTGVVPLFSSDPGPGRVFFHDPDYLAYYKYPYWCGISFITASLMNEFIFFLSGYATKLRVFSIFFLGITMLALTAHRGPLFVVFLGCYTLYYQAHPQKLSIRKLLLHTLIGMVTLMTLLYMREGSNAFIEWMVAAVSHGSTFVDFAELVDALDRFGNSAFLLGKTYLGDLLGFIPYGIFDFRDQYRWKEWTKILFDAPPSAGGYRLTPFGESYFNFGLLGVAVQGLLAGFLYAVFDPMVLALSRLFKEKKGLAISWYILLNVALATAVSAVLRFYDILFLAANLFSVVAIFLLAIFLRHLFRGRFEAKS